MYPQSSATLSASMKSSSLRSPKRLSASTPHGNPQRNQNMQLPGLPRFHPAVYPYHSDSTSSSPSPGVGSPQSPNSPRQQHRQYSDAQRQLYLYQRELVNLNLASNTATGTAALAPNASTSRTSQPSSPRLHPLGSPGPVTPLELEGNDGYLLAGATQQLSEHDKNEIIESYIKKEATKRHSGGVTLKGRHKPTHSR